MFAEVLCGEFVFRHGDPQTLIQLCHGFLLQTRQDMGIGIHRNGNGGMAETLADDFGMNPLDKHQGCVGVAEIVKANAVEPMVSGEGGKGVGEPAWIPW